MKIEIGPGELRENKEVSFLKNKDGLSQKKKKLKTLHPNQRVLKPEMPFIFLAMSNAEGKALHCFTSPPGVKYPVKQIMKCRPHCTSYFEELCNAKPTSKQMKSLTTKVFSQLLNNVILPVSSHFP